MTGGCGFIGSHLVDALVADGHSVTVLDNLSTGTRDYLPADVKLVMGDVADTGLVASLVAKADAVFHLAAVAGIEACELDRKGSQQTNVVGTAAVFEAAQAVKIPVVYASSAAVYGDNPHLPLGELTSPSPISAYGRDKLANEQCAREAWEQHGVPNVGLRFFNVYGPRQDPRSPYSGVITKFIAALQSGKPITYFGDGEQTRDFIYVGDIVRLLMRALSYARGADVFNGCTGRQTGIKTLAEAIGRAMGKPVVSHQAAAKLGDIRYSCGDPARAKAALGFVAAMPLDAGLSKVVGHA